MKKLKGRNIVKLLDVFFTKNNVYIIQEFCDSGDLRQLMKKNNGPIPEKKAKEILCDIVEGFVILCKNQIIHRDLKPENILIHEDIYKIADFGFVNLLKLLLFSFFILYIG